jgi:Concanavalin A-like lectin/glucanases superfamily
MCRKLTSPVCFALMFGILLPTVSLGADPNLIGWWKLDEGSGDTVFDSSRSGTNGTIAHADTGGLGPGGSVWFNDPDHGTVLSFDGDDTNGAHVVAGRIPPMTLTNDFTWAFWAKQDPAQATNNDTILGNRYGGTASPLQFIKFTPTRFEFYNNDTTYSQGINYAPVPGGVWVHHVIVKDGTSLTYYRNGVESGTNTITKTIDGNPFYMGGDASPAEHWRGYMSDVRLYTRALTYTDVLGAMQGLGEPWPYASSPNPADGALHNDTWINLSWKAGAYAVSHDVYLGDSFGDVNDATHESGTFRGNQALPYYVAGFPGFAYPDGLVPGTTYYWRIDEVNEAEPNSPWKSEVWSFSIPPRTAYNPDPADGAESVAVDVKPSWTPGFGARLHTVYFGDKSDTVANATGGSPQAVTTYDPGPLKRAKTYYWRVDEFDGTATYQGDVWSFTTEGAVGNPQPANGAVDVKQTPVLTWTPGAYAASHEVYFGADANAVRNATKTSPEFKATKALGDESYAPGKLAWKTTYYWRIDEVNSINPDGPWKGNVWSFTTADYAVIDDFEEYDAGDNQIWYAWHDGLGYGTAGTANYFAGNGTGAAVGDETTASFTEETIVHGGKQSMPLAYDNNKQGYAKYSETELTLTNAKDWTEGGVAELSIWFRGRAGSVGSFVEAPAGTYTMTATGADIWGTADQFHFAYKTLTGVGSIQAKVLSVDNTDPWAKGGVMIRETLDAGSKFAAVYITPGNGCRFQARTDTDVAAVSDSSVATTEQKAIKAPYWVKLERDVAGNFRGYYSADGSTWTPMSWNPQAIAMGSNIYVGLALTAHNANATCTAKFSNVTTTGTVGPQWADQDIGIPSNAPEPLYVAVSNAGGQPAVVTNPDPNAATTTTWTEWVIPLSDFSNQGINLTNVDQLAIGLGTRGNMTTPGGSGKMYFDDIRLYRPRTP